jgi:hypothetical protein
MWEKHLASQLLWRVEPLFANGLFQYPSKRPAEYCAPTFSWAAVDSETGVTCGEITDQDLLICVNKVEVTPVTDKFGLVKDGSVTLTGCLRRVEIDELVINRSKRYGWRLRDANRRLPIPEWRTRHTNVYLDSPSDDSGIFGPDSDVYCLPAVWDGDEKSGRYLICILLQFAEQKGDRESAFKRIGLTKVACRSNDQKVILEPLEDQKSTPHCSWDEEAGGHKIRVI